MRKHFYLSILLCLLWCPAINGQNAKLAVRGKVIAYIESNVDVPPHSFIPRSDVLIVQITRLNKTTDEFIKIVNEYFSEESPLSKGVFEGEEQTFVISRRTDCDSLLIPDTSEFQKSIENKDGETWTINAPSVKFVRDDEIANVPNDKILPCYSFVSAQESAKKQKNLWQENKNNLTTVEYCALIKDPEKYDGKEVTVRAAYRYGFEWSEIFCLNCRKKGKTWLEIDEDNITKNSKKTLKKFPRDDGTINALFTGTFESSKGPFGDGGYRFRFEVKDISQAELVTKSGADPEQLPADIQKKIYNNIVYPK